MVDRPSEFPNWATTLNIDNVSGQQNYLEPPGGKKVTGFDREEVPPRQWINWLHRQSGLWINFLDQEVVQAQADIVQAEADIVQAQADIVTIENQLTDVIYTDTNTANLALLIYVPSQYELILRKTSPHIVYGLLKITVSFTGAHGAFSVWKITNIPEAFRPASDVQTSIYMAESAELRPHVVTATDDGDLEFKKPTANYADPGSIVTYEYSSFMYTLKA